MPPRPPVYYDSIVCFLDEHRGLGEFEQIVLLALAHLPGETYAIPIVDEIERRMSRDVVRAAVHITLGGLEENGFVSTWIGDPTPERGEKGGPPRRGLGVQPTEALRAEYRKSGIVRL